MAERLLEIKGLKTHFFTEEGVVRAVDGIDLRIDKGETLGVVGESGCGKTVTALSVMKLIPMPPGKIVEGQMLYEGRDLVTLPPAQMRKVRGKEISMVFQEPMTSLNPVFTIGEQIAEAIRLHEGLGRRAAMDKTVEMLKIVHIPNRSRRSPISSRIWAWIVTSSAVVGSSAMSSFGWQESAIAIITRWRIPPDSSCGYCRARRSG